MTGIPPLPPAHRRVRGGGVLLALVWVAFHLLGCVHSHASALGAHHVPMNAGAAVSAPAAPSHAGPVVASSSDRGPCCPESDHAADWFRTDAPSAPAPGGALAVQVQPCLLAAVPPGGGTVRTPDHRLVGGRCVLTTLCVART
ncbi:hypothetical protein ACFVWY_10175 [Streptomyces sp. NPDC058195]|uniref:hypothetical protein n=1 Tax=Streptomyces sp. NPDC058195 TaxID=3346375 RepID=UPI0036E5D0AC